MDQPSDDCRLRKRLTRSSTFKSAGRHVRRWNWARLSSICVLAQAHLFLPTNCRPMSVIVPDPTSFVEGGALSRRDCIPHHPAAALDAISARRSIGRIEHAECVWQTVHVGSPPDLYGHRAGAWPTGLPATESLEPSRARFAGSLSVDRESRVANTALDNRDEDSS